MPKKGNLNRYLQIVFIIGLVACRAIVSHAAASHFHPVLSVCINFIHLLFKDIWTGGTLVMIVFLSLNDWDKRSVHILFSKVTAVALLFGGVTGTFIVWLHLKGFSELVDNNWGRLFCILSFAAAVLMFSRALVIQELSRNSLSEKKIKKFYYTESIASVAVLLLTSVLIITTPPIHQLTYYSRSVSSNGNTITLSDAGSGEMVLTMNRPQRVKKVTVVLENEDRQIGPIVVEPQHKGNAYLFKKTNFLPPGEWNVQTTVEQSDAYDANANFKINYPSDLEVKRGDEQVRIFGVFEVVMISVGVLIVWLFIFWWKKLQRAGEQN